MSNESRYADLHALKELTGQQYDAAKARAVERVQARLGQKPTREQFKRDLGPLWTALDVLAAVVFIAALAVSSAHIINHMSSLAAASFTTLEQAPAGIVISQNEYTLIHQLGMIALAEASMLLFMTMHGMSAERRAGRTGWARWFSLPLLLALAAGLFVFVANWQSNIGILESIMPPVFTIGLGVHLERLIVESLRRRDDVTRRYLEALAVWERAQEDLSTHPDFAPTFAAELWEKLVSLKANQDFKDAPAAFKRLAVQREMARERWAYDLAEGVQVHTPIATIPASHNGHTEVAPSVPLSVATTMPSNGNGRH